MAQGRRRIWKIRGERQAEGPWAISAPLLTGYASLVWPWNTVVWYVWLPAGCAFALAPAHQLETIYQAVAEGKAIKPNS